MGPLEVHVASAYQTKK